MHPRGSGIRLLELAVPSMSHAERGRLGGLKRAYRQSPEERHEQARRMHLAGAVKAVVDRAPELTPGQRARIRAILLPVVPSAETLTLTEDHEDDDAPEDTDSGAPLDHPAGQQDDHHDATRAP
jgi:hypothetical protein